MTLFFMDKKIQRRVNFVILTFVYDDIGKIRKTSIRNFT